MYVLVLLWGYLVGEPFDKPVKYDPNIERTVVLDTYMDKSSCESEKDRLQLNAVRNNYYACIYMEKRK